MNAKRLTGLLNGLNRIEKTVLCGLLLKSEELMPASSREIIPEHFRVKAHAILFEILRELYDSHKPIDFIVLVQLLRDRQLLDKVGGPAFLARLFAYVPIATNFQWYLEALRDRSAKA